MTFKRVLTDEEIEQVLLSVRREKKIADALKGQIPKAGPRPR